jgi:hypothetical protein
MSFGVADYAASTRARTTVIGGVNPDYGVLTDKREDGSRDYYWMDQWHAAQTRMMVACRAYGLRPIDGRAANGACRAEKDDAARRLPAAVRVSVHQTHAVVTRERDWRRPNRRRAPDRSPPEERWRK